MAQGSRAALQCSVVGQLDQLYGTPGQHREQPERDEVEDEPENRRRPRRQRDQNEIDPHVRGPNGAELDHPDPEQERHLLPPGERAADHVADRDLGKRDQHDRKRHEDEGKDELTPHWRGLSCGAR